MLGTSTTKRREEKRSICGVGLWPGYTERRTTKGGGDDWAVDGRGGDGGSGKIEGEEEKESPHMAVDVL